MSTLTKPRYKQSLLGILILVSLSLFAYRLFTGAEPESNVNSLASVMSQRVLAATEDDTVRFIQTGGDVQNDAEYIAYFDSTYVHNAQKQNFSFPQSGFHARLYSHLVFDVRIENGVETVVYKDPLYPMGYFIISQPFDHPASVITKERIEHDLPDTTVHSLWRREWESGIPGISLETNHPYFGRMHEEWFVHNGYLHQIVIFGPYPIDFRTMATPVLESLEFSDPMPDEINGAI